VLYVSPVAERGGAEVVLLNILRHHDRVRFTPMVCLLKEGSLSDEVRRLEIKSFLVPTGRFRHVANTLRTVRQIRRLLKEENVDLVFSNMAMGHVYGGLAALGTPVKRVWFQHTISSGQTLDRLAALIPADRLYVNSQASLRAVNRFRPRAKHVQLVYPGIDALSTAAPEKRFHFRREFGIPDDVPLVAMVGRFQRWKGQHVFIEAAAEVCRHEPKARFVVVGDTTHGLEPDYKAQIESLVTKSGLSSSVIFTGWRNDVPEILNEVDVLAHPPTAAEPFGLVVIEALLQGKPVVVSDQGGLKEIVTDGENGFLVPPGNATALAGKILLLLSDETLRVKMGGRGRELVLERFTMARMIKDMEESYLQIMRGSGTKVLR
jgi:glycosyltransferase involved in cell wall biosynthesis